MRKAAIVGVVLATVSVLALVGGADFAPVAGPLRLGQDGSVNDFPNQVALVKDAAGNSHILFYSDDQRSLTYAMVGPDGSTKIATTTIYPQITTQSGPVEAAVTGAGKVFVVFNQAGRNQGDGDTRYMILDPASQPQNGAAANNQAPFVAVSDTVISKADGIHSHRPQVAADPAGNLHVVWWDGFCCPTSPSEPTDASSLHYRKFGPNGENLIDDRTLLTPSAQPYLGQPIDIDVDQRGNVHVGFEGAVVPPVRYQTLSNPDRFVIEWITGQDSPFDSMWPAHSQLVLYPDGHFVVNQIDARAVDEQLPGFTRGFIGPNQGSGGHSTRAEPVTETAKSFSFVTDGIGGDYLSAEIPATAETLDNPVAPIRLAAGVRNTRRAETVALPFAFTFYGTSYNNVNLTNKGYVRFDPTSDSQVNDSPPVYPSSSASNTNIIDALRYANMASGFQANGYLMVDGATGNLLIGPSTFPRTDYLMRWPRLEVDAFGQVNHVWQQKGASPDVITDSVSASEIWHERFDPYRMPLDGTPITDWNVVRTVAPHPLTVGDGGLSHHPVVASEPSGKIFVTYNRDVADDTDYHNNAADDDVMLLALDPRSGAVTDGPTLVSAKNGDDFHNRTGIAGSQGSARVDLAWPDSTQTAPSSSGTDGIVYEAFTTAELPNNPPVPTISASPPTGSFPRSVTLALGAADPDGDFIASYRVSFGDGTPDLVGSGSPPATVVHTYQGPGPYTVTLTVTDGRGLSGSASALVSGPGAPGGGPAKEFFFAEGTTRTDFDEFILLSNPNPAATTVTLRYEKTDGTTVDQVVSVPANSRSTVQVWTFLGRGVDHSTHALSTLPIVAERAIYLNHGFTSLGIVNGGDTVVGESSPRARWDFAEGTTLDGFQEYLTLQNPNATATVATLTFGTESSPGVPGPVVTRSVSLAATSRTTIDVNSPTEGIGTGVLGHATRVTSDLPILAERPLYFNRVIEGTLINGATVAFGTAPSPSVFLGEGNVLPSWFEFLTVANPDTANDATVDITYFFEGGQAPIVKTVSVPKAGRRTIQVFNTSDPGGVGRNVSDPLSRGVSAQVSTTSAQGVVVERPLYFDALIDKGLTVNEGTDKPGPAGPAASWYFAEGTSLPDFLTFFTISNPNLSTASVTATYLTNLGEVVPRSFTIPAASRLTIQVYNPAQIPSGALGLEREGFATTFVSDRPIVVERPIYEVHVFPDIDTPIAGGQLVVGRAG